jgi:hypothetical protein
MLAAIDAAWLRLILLVQISKRLILCAAETGAMPLPDCRHELFSI